jgi:hypothetical protein
MRVCVELPSNNSGKAFTGLSSRACNSVEIASPPLYFVDPKIDLCSRECLFPRMAPETGNDFDPWHAVVSEQFDGMALFDFHIIDPFSPIDRLFSANIPQL